MANYQNMKVEDLYKLRDNKVNYGNTNNQAHKDVYNLNNKNIRAAYGMTDADDVSLNQLDQYIAAAEKQQATEYQKNGLLTNLTKKAMEGDARLQKSADELRNFNYDPTNDPMYNVYSDMYNREGQSAAKSTLNNLNAANMGRNSFYSAAATAQVQQAYAQKASEMIPTLAEQAYNKLLQRYSIDKDMSDTQFNRELTAYQTVADAETRDIQNESARLQLNAMPEQIKLEFESGRLANQLTSLQIEGMTYENRVAAVTAEIQEKYGLPMAQAEYLATQLAAVKSSGGKGGSGGIKTTNIDKVIKGINDALKGKSYYYDLINNGYINEGDDIIRGSNGVYSLGNGFTKGSWGQPIVQALYNSGLSGAEVSEAIRLLGLEDEWVKFSGYGA